MKSYNTLGTRIMTKRIGGKVTFSHVYQGQTFRLGSRLLIKIRPLHVADAWDGRGRGGEQLCFHDKPPVKMYNAIQLTSPREGQKSSISRDTMVEVLPNAAIYTLG